MINFYNRTSAEQTLIRNACDFEVEMARKGDSSTNPYYEAVLALADGSAVWEGINAYLEEFVF